MSKAKEKYDELFAWFKPEENPDAPNWMKVVYDKVTELEQQKNTLEQYLRIEKEVSDETIKELEQQNKELMEALIKCRGCGYFKTNNCRGCDYAYLTGGER